MKYVREHINEKFTQNSDPISDMGIGKLHDILKWYKELALIKKENYNYNEILKSAIFKEKYEYVNYLLDSGLANIEGEMKDCAPLRIAAFNDKHDMVKLLLKKGANLNAAIKRAKEYHDEKTLAKLQKIRRSLGKYL